MLTVSLRTKYGLKAMVALAGHFRATPLQIRRIAEDCSIPQNYLEQVLVALKKTGLVQSFRGSQGGYVLTKDPSQISVKDIVTCLEGPISLTANSQESSLLFFWQEAETAIEKVFELSLSELIHHKQQQEGIVSYAI